MAEEKKELKEDQSRMEGAYGARVIKNLKCMRVFIVGLKGLGLETAKNLILSGPKAVTVHDDSKAVISDLNTNFYLRDSHLGNAIGPAITETLQELNPNVAVACHTGELKESDFDGFDVVCFTDHTPLEDLIRYNDYCRNLTRVRQRTKRDAGGKPMRDENNHEIVEDVVDSEGNPVMDNYCKFIWANIDGVVGSVFSDFSHHIAFDKDGTELKELIVDDITIAENGVVTVDGERHGLHNGDRVRFEGVIGMCDEAKEKPQFYGLEDEIKDINWYCDIKDLNKCQFTIGDTRGLQPYQKGTSYGTISQVKVDTEFNHKPLSEQLATPDFNFGYMDFQKFGKNEQLHIARNAVWRFQKETGHYPRLHNQEDANRVVELAKAINTENGENKGVQCEVDEKVFANCALYAEAELPSMAALFGGVVAQEIMKKAGKYSPISQWFHFDCFELLNDSVPEDAAPIGSRYDHQIAIFGKAFQEKLGRQRYFVVGCGALGCEYMKMVATTGMGLGDGGQVFVTDDDHVELSNLSRQFLFRRKHVNKPKSVSAGGSAAEMNPDVKEHLTVHETRVEAKTEDKFNDEFWQSLDFVVNALDNNHARRYTDGKCVLFQKPLFESGTLGTQANTVIVLPHHTPSYSEGATAGEGQGIAMCTLRNFPSITLHCIEWARTMFGDTFTEGPAKYEEFRKDKEAWLRQNTKDQTSELSSLKLVKKWHALAAESSFQKCIDLAYETFEKRYRDAIKDLTAAYPRDARRTDPDSGEDAGPFWHGKHRYPNEVNLDLNDEKHIAYLWHTACIYADVFGLEAGSFDDVKAAAANITPSTWTKKKVNMEGEEKGVEAKEDDIEEEEEDEAKVTEALYAELGAIDASSLRGLSPADFEKDDDTNHHIDWITSACNLRCYNYNIKEAEKKQCRMIAGRIIAAIATTTASITGFVGLEIMKYIKHGTENGVDNYRMATIDLGVNTFVVENLPDKQEFKSNDERKCFPEGFSLWDEIVIDQGDLTIAEFNKILAEEHKVEVASLFAYNGDTTLYQAHNPYSGQYRLHSMLAKRSTNSAKNQATYEETIRNYQEWEANFAGADSKKILELYTARSGPLTDPNRKAIYLDGSYEQDGEEVLLPKIKYVFRH